MRISERGTRVVAEHVPGCLWLFGLWFVAGGLLVLTMLFVAENRDELSAREKLVVAAIGIAVAAAGVFTIRQHRSTRMECDRATGRCTHVVRTVLGPRVHTDFALMEARRIEVARSRDSEGDPMFQLRLWLSDSRVLPLDAQPRQGEEGALREARELAALLGLPEAPPG